MGREGCPHDAIAICRAADSGNIEGGILMIAVGTRMVVDAVDELNR